MHGGDIYSYINKYGKEPLDYSSNVNPLGIPELGVRHLMSNIDKLSNYPDYNNRELIKELSIFHNCEASSFVPGNGASDLIYQLVRALKPERGIVLAPSFSEYEKALNSIGAKTEYLHLCENNNFDITKRQVDSLHNYDNVNLLFICSPNNPTGRGIDNDLLHEIIHICLEKNIYVLLDECFLDFRCNSSELSFYHHIKKYPNLFVLKATTKFYGMAGLRLGYMVSSNTEVLNIMRNTNAPWSISVAATLVGTKIYEALNKKITTDDNPNYDIHNYINKSRELISEERVRLSSFFTECGFKVFPTNANYMLLKLTDSINNNEIINVDQLQTMLEQKGILIRNCSNYEGLSNQFFRIAIKDKKSNEYLMTVFKNTLSMV